MLKIQDGRIIIAEASVKLPNGLYLSNYNDKRKKLMFKDENINFHIELTQLCGELPEFADTRNSVLLQKGFIIKDKTEITVNGLRGYYIIYRITEKECYEAWLKNDIEKYETYLKLQICAYTKKTNITDVLQQKTVNDFFCNIRAE